MQRTLVGKTFGAVVMAAGSTAPAPPPQARGQAGGEGAATGGPTAYVTQDRSRVVNGYTPGAPIATAAGTMPEGSGTMPAKVEVLALEAHEHSTIMRYRIVPGQDTTFRAEPWSPSGVCPDGVKLVDPASKKVYSQALGTSRTVAKDLPDCLGPKPPRGATPEKPLYLFAYFGPLPADTSTVTLRIPGFKDTPVPVPRR